VSHTADQSDTTGTSYANGIITNGAILLSELLAGEQPAAPTVAPTQTATSMPTATATRPATPSPTATLTQTATPTATATRTPAAAPTRTATPTATATSQPEPTTGPMSFSVLSVKLAYGSAKPKNALHHASLTKVHQGQTIKLLLYVEYRGIEGRIPVRASFRVLRAGSYSFLRQQQWHCCGNRQWRSYRVLDDVPPKRIRSVHVQRHDFRGDEAQA